MWRLLDAGSLIRRVTIRSRGVIPQSSPQPAKWAFGHGCTKRVRATMLVFGKGVGKVPLDRMSLGAVPAGVFGAYLSGGGV